MSCFKFLIDNYTQTCASKSVSSENASYPVSNLYDVYRRNKVWRSAGYWDLSGDLTIVFRETIGVDLTATIASNEYTSDTTFLAAVKTALDAAGASTYAVTRDTSGKIKITSDGLGGGGIFQLMFANAASEDMATVMGFDLVNLTGALTYTADELRIHTYEFIKWDLGYLGKPKAFVLTGPRNSPLKISTNAVLKLQGNETDNFTNPSFEETLSFDDYIYQTFNVNGLHTDGLRYWRIYIEDKANSYGYIEAGLVYLGDANDFDRGAPQFGMSVNYIDRSDVIYSEGGQSFTDIRQLTEKIGMDIAFLTKEDIELLDDYWHRFGQHYPFFISVDSNSVFSTSANRWVRYVKFDSAPNYVLRSPNNFTAVVDFREQL